MERHDGQDKQVRIVTFDATNNDARIQAARNLGFEHVDGKVILRGDVITASFDLAIEELRLRDAGM